MCDSSKPFRLCVLLLAYLFGQITQAKYGGGSGTADDPYRIATPEDLMLLGETPEDYDKHFILTADIDLDPNLPGGKVFDKAVIVPKASWEGGTPFTGVFDGKGHTISRLTIRGGIDLGLFGYLADGAEVKNLGLVHVNITGSGRYIGGLVGDNDSGVVTQCYSTGSVSSTGWYVGGLVGSNYGRITNSYSTGTVSGLQDVAGLVGSGGGGVTHSFWDIQTSGQASSDGGTGKTTAEMQTASTFLEAGWDFVNIWGIGENQTYPYLRKYSAADINQDASVNFLDLAALAKNWLATR